MQSLEGNHLININELEERKNNFLFIAKEGKTSLKSGTEALLEKNKEVLKVGEEETISTDELRGRVAYPGKIVGDVKIVVRSVDFSKLKYAHILVAHMTTVDYMPYMDKVSAIVTDEGGFGCHAAILSREFKIPCIVGTKIATKALKDDDTVEVNAYEGVVKILKRK